MLKRFAVLTILMPAFLLTGCWKKPAGENAAAGSQNATAQSIQRKVPAGDFDLVGMKYDKVSDIVFDIQVNPDKYLGKTFSFRGQYFAVDEKAMGSAMHSVLLYDKDACCQTGLQFEIKNPENKPNSAIYPKQLQTVEIFGKLCYKDFNGMDYYYLECDGFVPIDNN